MQNSRKSRWRASQTRTSRLARTHNFGHRLIIRSSQSSIKATSADHSLCVLSMEIDQAHDSQQLDESTVHTFAPSSSSSSMPLQPSTVAEAFERRLRQQREEQQAGVAAAYVPFDEDHEKRQELRRMIDPGILRPNPRPLALESLRVLTTTPSNYPSTELIRLRRLC